MSRPCSLPRPDAAALLTCLALGSLLSWSTPGCGASSARDPSRDAPPALLSLVPSDAEGVALVEVGALLETPVVARLVAALEPYMDERGRALHEVLRRVDQVAVAYRRPLAQADGEPLLVLARGRFVAADLDTLGRDQAPGQHRTHPLRREQGTTLALNGEHTLAFGSEPLVLAALDRMDGLAPATGPTGPAVLAAAQRAELGRHMATYASEVSERFRRELSDEFSPRGAAQSMGAWLDLRSALDAYGFVSFTSSHAAEEVASQLRAKLAEARAEPFAADVGLVEVVDAIEVRTEGGTLHVHVTMSAEIVERVATTVLLGAQAWSANVPTAAPAGDPTPAVDPPEEADAVAP